jgi:hypothetical protein
MRIAPLVLLPLLVACASRKEAYVVPHKRDYYSINKSSVKFLLDGARSDRRLRKENFRRNWNWSELRRQNARIRKESLSFLGKSLTALEWEAAKQAWTVDLPRELKPTTNFGDSVRFGFLDSGD